MKIFENKWSNLKLWYLKIHFVTKCNESIFLGHIFRQRCTYHSSYDSWTSCHRVINSSSRLLWVWLSQTGSRIYFIQKYNSTRNWTACPKFFTHTAKFCDGPCSGVNDSRFNRNFAGIKIQSGNYGVIILNFVHT